MNTQPLKVAPEQPSAAQRTAAALQSSTSSGRAFFIALVLAAIGPFLIFVIAPENQFEPIYFLGYRMGQRETTEYVMYLLGGGALFFLAVVAFITGFVKD